MIYPSIDKLQLAVPSKYALVHIASKRSLEIKHTNFLQMPEKKYKSVKNIGRALEEITEGFLTLKVIDK